MWIVCDGEGFAHSYLHGLTDVMAEADKFEELEAAQEEAERLNLKYDTDGWFQVVDPDALPKTKYYADAWNRPVAVTTTRS